MKTSVSSLEYGRRQAEAIDYKTVISSLRSKITDKMCITLASMAIVSLLLSLVVFNIPAIIASGLAALGAVAIAPMEED